MDDDIDYFPMTAAQLGVGIADDYHDWIDEGEDYPVDIRGERGGDDRYSVEVEFASGARFKITVEEM